MKYVLLYIFLILLIGCSESIVVTPEKKAVESILHSVFNKRSGGGLRELSNSIPHEKKIIQVVANISNIYYGNKIHMTVFAGGAAPAQALPFNTILLSEKFLKYISRSMTYEEQSAILCHESMHILNNDWQQRIIKEKSYSYREATGQWKTKTRVAFYPKSLYEISKKAGFIRGSITYEGYKKYILEDFKTSAGSTNDHYVTDKTKGVLHEYKVGKSMLTDSQGFALAVEMQADEEALECLGKINVNKINMLKVLKKINNKNLSSFHARIDKRIENLISILGRNL